MANLRGVQEGSAVEYVYIEFLARVGAVGALIGTYLKRPLKARRTLAVS
jgi:hypothetical protein